MKIKKKSVAAILTAAMLVAGVTAVFATSRVPEPQNFDELPQAVQSEPLPVAKPSPAPAEKPAQSEETKTPSLAGTVAAAPWDHDIVHDKAEGAGGTADTPEYQAQEPAQPESAAPVLENRWGVPDGEIPPWTEFTVDSFEDAHDLGNYLETVHGLYPGDYTVGYMVGVRYVVQVHYQERAIRERLPDGVYPVNSKGETYGSSMDSTVIGYKPDLISIQATNGKSGYATAHDLRYGGYPGEVNNPDDALVYMEWLKTQPSSIMIPVYDVNRDNVIGYFALGNSSGMTPAEELEMVADQLRRNMGLSEDEIAEELERLKEAKGWYSQHT